MKIGFLSDAHGNCEALEKGFDILERSGASDFFFLGDAIGYMPGVAALERLRQRAVPCVRGNHEDMFLSGNWPSKRNDVYLFSETRRSMSNSLLRTIQSWPTSRRFQLSIGPILMFHGSPDSLVRGYVYPDTDLSCFHVTPGTTVFMGNTHIPFIRRHSEVTYVNVGSCGLPRDRGDMGSACLFDTVSNHVKIIRFNIALQTAEAIARCGRISSEVMAVFSRRPQGHIFGELYEE